MSDVDKISSMAQDIYKTDPEDSEGVEQVINSSECVWVSDGGDFQMDKDPVMEKIELSGPVEIYTEESDVAEGSPAVIESNSNIRDVSHIVLSEQEWSQFQTEGYIFLSRNLKKYLLDGEGIKEIFEGDVETSEELPIQVTCSNNSNKTDYETQMEIKDINDDSNTPNETFSQLMSYQEDSSTMPKSPTSKTNELSFKMKQINAENVEVIDDVEYVSHPESLDVDTNKKEKAISEVDFSSKKVYTKVTNQKEYDHRVSYSNIFKYCNKNASNSLNDDRIFMGKALDGKEIYARVIDFKSADGSLISDEKLAELSGRIKGELAQMIVSGKDINEAHLTKDESAESSTTYDDTSEIIILYNNEVEFKYNSSVIIEKSNTRFVNDINSSEVQQELNIIKKVLKSVISIAEATHECSQIISKKLKILKNSSFNKGITYEFIGKMFDSDVIGWEFLSSPELKRLNIDIDEEDPSKEDVFIINISTDEKFQHHLLLGAPEDLDDDSDIDPRELDEELKSVKSIMKNIFQLMQNQSDSKEDEISHRYIKIHKTVKDPDPDNSNNHKEYIFTGKMYKSNVTGWEFIYLPKLMQKCDQIDFFVIQISVDEESNGAEVKYVEEITEKNGLFGESMIVSDDDILKLSETKKINGRKHYECIMCKKRFNGLMHFKRHERTHRAKHGDSSKTVFKCPLCECVFYYQSTYTKHLVSAHRDSKYVQTA